MANKISQKLLAVSLLVGLLFSFLPAASAQAATAPQLLASAQEFCNTTGYPVVTAINISKETGAWQHYGTGCDARGTRLGAVTVALISRAMRQCAGIGGADVSQYAGVSCYDPANVVPK